MKSRYLFAVLLVLGAAMSSGCLAANVFFIAPDTSEAMGYAVTEDGWEIAVYHYPAKNEKQDKYPVVLCHGMALNSFYWHVTADNNFPQWLADRGYDVWACDLRGNGQSRYRKRYDRFVGINTRKKSGAYWTVDDYANFDVPAVLRYVSEKTGKPKISWIGHSMGGMVLYAYLVNHPDDELVGNFVTLGSPIIMPQPPNDILGKMVKDADIINVALDMKLMKMVLRSAATASLMAPNELDILYYRRDNVTSAAIVSLWANSCENIERGVSEQLMEMVKTGDFWSAALDTDYATEARRINVPILLICAKADNMAPEIAVQYAYHRVGSADKTYRLFALANKYSADYGHCDLITGKNARREVYPVIIEWLDEH